MNSQYQGSIFAAILLTMVSAPAYAYLDPGTGSVILQALIAMVVVGFASLKLWWYKLLGFFNAHKPNKVPAVVRTKENDNDKRENL
ncbi:MAG: hypothetical protein ACI8SJ_000843 [Shewanella sp.]|jgi:hypothetical protein